MLQMNKAIDKQFRKQISFDLHFILIFYDQQTQKNKTYIVNLYIKYWLAKIYTYTNYKTFVIFYIKKKSSTVNHKITCSFNCSIKFLYLKHIQRLIWDCNDEIKTGHFLAGTPKKRKQKYIFTYLKLKKENTTFQ